ncbi:MAG TPA: P-loop NTPase fold protein [Phycisphaerales bacterium]|nr:P-loop NTPase fold protein [Phycisphaerales bacterium]
MSIAEFNSFDADRPVTTRACDRYNRFPFAQGVARLILSLPRSECFTLSINAPWGDGKTSVLNFVAEELRGQDCAVTGYNPWLYGDSASMIQGLFAVLSRAMRVELKRKAERLAGDLARIASLAAPLDDRIDKARQLLKAKGDLPLEEVRERLQRHFRRANRQVVVFIDDIDRLDAVETVSLLRTLKACADLPGVVYVLAFDRDVVAEVIGNHMTAGGTPGGHRYLEKIVQVSLSVPPALPTELSNVCHENIDAVLRSHSITVDEEDIARWRSAFTSAISRRLRTPRSVTQYTNAIRFALPMLKGEANTVDVLLVEALRVLYPAAYQVVRSHLDEFVTVDASAVRSWSPNSERPVVPILREVLPGSDFGSVTSLLTDLFPLFTLHQQLLTTTNQRGPWMRAKRACSPAYAARYFTYAVGRQDVSDESIQVLLSLAGEGSARLQPQLMSMLRGGNHHLLLEKLELATTEVTPTAARRLAVALAVSSTAFPEPFSLYRALEPGIGTSRLAARLTHLAGPREWVAAAEEIISEAPDWFVGAYFERVLPPTLDKSSKEVQDAAATVSRAFSTRFNRMVRSTDDLLDLERRWRFEMIYQYARAAGREAAGEVLAPKIRNNGAVVPLLLQLASQPVTRNEEPIPAPGTLNVRGVSDLSLIVELDLLYEVAKTWAFNAGPLRSEDGVRREPPEDAVIRQFVAAWPLLKKGDGSRDTEA